MPRCLGSHGSAHTVFDEAVCVNCIRRLEKRGQLTGPLVEVSTLSGLFAPKYF